MGEKQAVYVQAILGTVQFRMLHVQIYKTDIVPVILCGVQFGVLCQKKHRLGNCDGREGGMFGGRGREGVTEGCRMLCSELHVCYCLVREGGR